MRAAALACLLATAVAADRHVLYSRTASHAEWTKGVRAESTAPVSFTVAVRQQNLDVLEEKFWAVSTPGSAEYQQFLTPEEIADIVRSDEADMLAVKEWLVSAEGASCTTHADAFACKAPVSTVEQLFNTEMYVFTNMMDGVKIVRHWGDMSIPASIKPAVDMITGFSHFPEARYGRSGPVNDVDYYVVPETIVNFYGLDGISGSSKSIQSVAEFQSYPPYSQSDLDTFETNTGIQHFDVVKKIGPFNPSYPAAESTLDIQYIGAVGAGNSNWYWTTPDWMYEFSLQLSTMTDAPMVISMSYGWDEAQQCKISPNICAQQGFDSEGFVKRVNTEFQKIGARGVSLLASAGDAGSHGRTDEECQSPTLNPTFPAASPYLTAVGATQIKNGKSENAKAPICQQIQCATGGVEVVASHGTGALITSGGGFSGYAPRPSYQDAVVSAYLQNSSVVPPTSDFNAAGRGYPDVAALGHKYYIELGGQIQAVDGTSASSPVFAGVVGLLNGYLLENGKKQLGFLNPFLYKMAADQPSTFNDITVGSNKCTEYTCCQTGFTATTGWDAASGLGSPQAGEMIKYLQSQFNIEATTTGLRGAAQ